MSPVTVSYCSTVRFLIYTQKTSSSAIAERPRCDFFQVHSSTITGDICEGFRWMLSGEFYRIPYIGDHQMSNQRQLSILREHNSVVRVTVCLATEPSRISEIAP